MNSNKVSMTVEQAAEFARRHQFFLINAIMQGYTPFILSHEIIIPESALILQE